MRLFHDAKRDAYIVSHTVRFSGNDNYQFGLTSIASDGTVNWVRAYKAGSADVHASHPYALAQALDGNYAIGGLATLPAEQTCEGEQTTQNLSFPIDLSRQTPDRSKKADH